MKQAEDFTSSEPDEMATYQEDPAQLWSQPPTETDEVAALFNTIRAGGTRPDAFREAAQRANQAIDERLMQQYGHENPIDWYDHPTATILVAGRAASERIAQYDENNAPNPNQIVKDWHQTLLAYAFCTTDIKTSNRLMADTETYGQFEDKTLVLGE